MRTFTKMFLSLALIMLGVMNVSAGERISLQEVPFCTWDGWGADAKPTGTADCLWVIGEGSGNVYGDTDVKNYADLSLYAKLIVTVTNGTPRFLLNRDIDEGQWKADESESHLIDNTQGGWSSKYFSSETTDEGTVYTVDLKQLAKDKGFAHLHAIKGANWQDVTVVSMEVERQGKVQQIGWTSIINNGDFEGDDMSSFVLALKADSGDGDVTYASERTEGAGKDGSYGLKVESMANAPQTWSTQLFVKFNEAMTEGTKWRFTMDVKSDAAATVNSGSHAAPRTWIDGGIISEFTTANEWQTITAEGTISKNLAEKNFGSIAFDLNNDKVNANTFYFDNINFEVYKYGTTAEFSNDVILVDFGFDTNISELVKASGKKRLMFPMDCVTVKVNGKVAELYSVEGFDDGRFYIFLNEAASEGDEVLVSFTNPDDQTYHLIYTSGPGGDVNSFTDVQATLNDAIEDNEGYPYDYVTPIVVKADPEDGSFNLPNSIKDFKLAFDKNVDCAALVATINGQAMTVAPATGFAEEVTLTRVGTDDLPTGEYTVNVTKIYPEMRLSDEVFGDTTYVLNVGKVELDPNDVEETIMTDDFAASGDSWIVNSGSSDGSMQAANAGSGCRLMHNQSGFAADILYLGQRDTPNGGVALYGIKESAKLTLKAKNYHLTLKAAKWDGNGADRTLKVQVLPESAVNFEDGSIIDETQILVEERKAIEPDFKTTTKSTDFDLVIPVTTEGNYIIRLVPGNNEGNPAGYSDASAIGNIKVQYLPNTAGAEWIRLLDAALESAKLVRDKFAGERYEGADFTALDAAIAKYEVEKEGYTNPSAYTTAADDLNALATALENHGNLCNSYDEQVKKAIDVVRQNKENKFAATELYTTLCASVDKYHGTSEWRNVAPEDEDPNYQLFYEYDVLKVDEELTAAIAELKDVVTTTSLLFTEGVSATGDSGVKVLADRLRRGAETLKSLGVSEDDELVMAAVNTLTDDDALAEQVKTRIKQVVYGQLKNADNELFKPTVDADNNEVVPTYDMSVFFKNPNIYALQVKNGVNAENVPGWEVTNGGGEISTMWVGGTPRNVPGIAEDVVFTKYHGDVRYEQTITDLPAGVYTVVLDAVSWADESDLSNGFVFVKTSATPAVEEGGVEDRSVNFAATADLTYHGQYVGHFDNVMEGIVVTDGQMTVGANFGNTSQWMFDQIKAIRLTAPANGFDYGTAYETGVETAKVAKVRSIELFGLDGRRVNAASKGIVIVRKYMNDGTVRTEKVVRK